MYFIKVVYLIYISYFIFMIVYLNKIKVIRCFLLLGKWKNVLKKKI